MTAVHHSLPVASQTQVQVGARRGIAVVVASYVVLVVTLVVIGLVLVHVGLLGSMRRWDEHQNVVLARHRTPAINRVSGWFTELANTIGIVVVAAVGTLVGLLRRWGRRTALLFTGLGLELVSFLTVNYTVRRPRPSVEHLGSTPSTFSWPSGHVAATLVLYGGLAVLVMCSTRRSAPRVAAWLLALILTAGVAFSRVYEGEHHVLDAMAGLALGIGALAAAVRAMAAGDLENAR